MIGADGLAEASAGAGAGEDGVMKTESLRNKNGPRGISPLYPSTGKLARAGRFAAWSET